MSVTRWASRSVIVAVAVIAALFAALLTAPSAHALNDTGDGGVYVPTSGRILDSRDGTGGFNTPFPAGTWRSVKVAGLAGVPTSGAGAVSLVLTAATPKGLGQLLGRPDSNSMSTLLLTYAGGNLGTTSNTAVMAIGADGTIQLQAGQQTDLIIDVQGYYTSNAGGTAAGGFVPLPGKQIVDTRSGQGAPKSTLAPGQSFTVQVTGSNGIPAGASALVANYDVINKGTNQGFITPYAAGTTRPATSLNYPGVQNSSTSMSAQVALSSDGKLTVYNASGAASTIDVIVVIQGYFTATGPGAAFTPAAGRVYDTRTAKTTVASNGALSIPVAGQAGAPVMGSGLQAVAITLTAIHGANSDGWAGVWADGTTEPNPLTSINYTPNSIRSNTVIVQVGTNGAIKIRNNSADTTDFVIDLQGWYSNPQAPSISCPQPYASGAWGAPASDSSVACTVTAGPAEGSGELLTAMVDSYAVSNAPLSDSDSTTITVSIPATAGEHTIYATRDQSSGDPTPNSYRFFVGDWTTNTFAAQPVEVDAPLTPTLAVEGSPVPFPNDVQFQYTVSTSTDGRTNPTAQSAWVTGAWTVPSGALQDGVNYYWTAQISGSTNYSATQSTVITPSWNLNAQAANKDTATTVAPSDADSQTQPCATFVCPSAQSRPVTSVVNKTVLSNSHVGPRLPGMDCYGTRSAPSSCQTTITATVSAQVDYGVSAKAVAVSFGYSGSMSYSVSLTCGSSAGKHVYGHLTGTYGQYKIQMSYPGTRTSPITSGWKYYFRPTGFSCLGS